MRLYLSGAVSMAFLVIGTCFLRFWIRTREKLFAVFCTAFWMLAFEKGLLATSDYASHRRPYLYLIRLIAFGLIAWAIIDKNKSRPVSTN